MEEISLDTIDAQMKLRQKYKSELCCGCCGIRYGLRLLSMFEIVLSVILQNLAIYNWLWLQKFPFEFGYAAIACTLNSLVHYYWLNRDNKFSRCIRTIFIFLQILAGVLLIVVYFALSLKSIRDFEKAPE